MPRVTWNSFPASTRFTRGVLGLRHHRRSSPRSQPTERCPTQLQLQALPTSLRFSSRRTSSTIGQLHFPQRHLTTPVASVSSTTPSMMRSHSTRFSPTAATPNHALQRTAPRVTVAAISGSDPSRPSVALSYARGFFLRSTTQLPRHAPPSLSLGSLGVSRAPSEN